VGAPGDGQSWTEIGDKSQIATNGRREGSPYDKTTDDKPAEIKPGGSPADWQKTYDEWKVRLAEEKEIDLLARELDAEQREYRLRVAAIYGDVGIRLRNSAEWDREDAEYKHQIAEKTKALDHARKERDNMQEYARKAGIPSSVRD
jgi:hypothetical protein